MVTHKKGRDPFRPRARLLVLLGEQLITNEVIAAVELVKNAYDADATESRIILDNVQEPSKGIITVEDNGKGMSLDTIRNVWLEPATDFRKKQRERNERTQKFKRLPLGEKGVGRFAAHKLGTSIEVITREGNSNEEVVVKVDWEDFEKNEYLDRVPISWEARSPGIFKGKNHGTRIVIKSLRKAWTRDMVKNLYIKLQGLNSPFIGKTDFSVEIKAPEFSEVLEKLPDLSEVLEKAVYKLEGEVDENGILKCNYLFQNEAFPQLKREIKNLVTDARDPKKFQGKRKPECGPFKVKFYVWDLDPASLGETIERPYYMNYVKPHTGIRIYRDYFRVWPYGEEDDDSFGLDLRRVNNPPVRLSRNQVIGIIEITSSENPELRDKTDREGLILNDDYEDFRNLVLMCLATIEAARREDKDKVDALREKKKPEDDVTLAIGSMKDKMKRKGHIDTYKEDVKKIETTYQRRVKEILEPLYVSAGLGIAYALPVHEILRNMGDMEKTLGTLVDDLKMRKASEESIAKLEKINQFAELIDDLVRGAGKLTRRGKPELIGLDSVVRDAHDIMNLRLKKDKIDVRIETKEKINVNMLRNLITTALLNILDNSSYWLMGNKDSDRKIIIITDHDKEGRPRIIVSDNGPGIKDDPALIIEPFFTRKPDGSGLGLYIVDRIMKAQEGEVQFLKKSDEKGLLDGANVALVFEKKKEKKQA